MKFCLGATGVTAAAMQLKLTEPSSGVVTEGGNWDLQPSGAPAIADIDPTRCSEWTGAAATVKCIRKVEVFGRLDTA